jgi:hypothetical protein
LSKHLHAYNFPDNSYFDNANLELHRKYAAGEARVEFELNDMSYKTPVLKDILGGKGAFSVEHLQAVYSSFLKLQKKHNNAKQTLQALLG